MRDLFFIEDFVLLTGSFPRRFSFGSSRDCPHEWQERVTNLWQYLHGRLPYWRLIADIFSIMVHLAKSGRVSLLNVLKWSPVCLHLVSLLRSHLWDRHTMLLPSTLRSIEWWPWFRTSDMFLLFRGVVYRSSSCVCVYYPVWTTQLSDISGLFC